MGHDNETCSHIVLRPDQSLIVVCFAKDAAGHMSRETASDHVVTWSENDGALSATSLWRDEALPEPLRE
jgi:hypothetical protein